MMKIEDVWTIQAFTDRFFSYAMHTIICDLILGKRFKSHISQNQTNTTGG